MSLLQLDPESIAARARSAEPVHIPTLKESILRGAVGFCVVSVLGFCPWALALSPAYTLGNYLMCAAVFLIASAPLLHRLIIGPGSLFRFYAVFVPGFLFYAAAWICCFSMIHIQGDKYNHIGGALGLLIGQALFASVLAFVFNAWNKWISMTLVLFLGNALGYFGWGMVVFYVLHAEPLWVMLMWGVCYGLGFGAGLGYAFYAAQEKARTLLKGLPS